MICLTTGRRCAKCGSSRNGVAGHHLITRSNLLFRHDLSNGIPLCFACHEWARAKEEEFLAWLAAKYPIKHHLRKMHLEEKPRPVLTHELEDRKRFLRGGWYSAESISWFAVCVMILCVLLSIRS